MSMDRREFLYSVGAAALSPSALLSAQRAAGVELGSIDGSVGGNQFTPAQFLDYLSSIKLTWAMISLPPATLADEAAIKAIRAHADSLGLKLQLAFGSVCPSARGFNAQLGTLEEQVARALRASQIFGATCMRCVLGGDAERPQIEMHIDNMIKAVRAIRSRIADSGVKLAVENHGGDLQAREMKMMVESVGTDICGVCLDSGNPVWMLEDPHMTLETLIPYAETSHVRDSAVWKVPEGIAVRWVNMGEGNVDIDGWIQKFIKAKPGLPIIFETWSRRIRESTGSTTPSSGTTGEACRHGSSVASWPWRRRVYPNLRHRGPKGKPQVSSESTISNGACSTHASCCDVCRDSPYSVAARVAAARASAATRALISPVG
jgi:3-oxoisoapionate decarboxylase